MAIEPMRQLQKAEPFRKFSLHLAEGRDIAVNHREFLAMSSSGRTGVVYQPADLFYIVDLILVTDLEVNSNRSVRQGCKKRS